MLTGSQIRASFLEFFRKNGHAVVASSALVPHNDPSLMFTNSGMVQFKNVFTGVEKKTYTRATSVQRCVRAGGKHNDLENVGHTARHHTFFEMMGNFSFGDYFKQESLTWGWKWVTEELKLDPARMCVTVYHTDDEAYNIWRKIGVAERDIIRIDTKDNFWMMGDTGPCGPCSEIFYDQGAAVAGGRPGTADADGDRWIEIWNHVFMQFEALPDGTRINLPKTGVDTGAGLERIASVVQGKTNNYDTDFFQPIIQHTAGLAGIKYGFSARESDVSLRVVADHLRAMSFLLVDGVMPSNEGRGYVLRRIMRRAMRHANLLGFDKPVIHQLAPLLVQNMGDAYPELARGAAMVGDVVKLEEERFLRTLQQGLKVLEQETAGLKTGGVLAGESAFKLYDTFGFPLDLTEDALRPRGLSVDHAGFEKEMQQQRERARKAFTGSGEKTISPVFFDVKEKNGATEFLGYQTLTAEARVVALVKDGQAVEALKTGEKAKLVVNQTPFYGESGGQVGDTGSISGEKGAVLKVLDTQKVLDNLFVHDVMVEKGTLSVGEPVVLAVDEARRGQIRRNHSVTHLMHSALHHVLGNHVFQKGSRVDEHKTRFDFSHNKAVSDAEIEKIEDWVNTRIWQNQPVTARVMPKDEAIALGAMALFGEKYGDEVRVLTMGDAVEVSSLELCGGTHVSNTGEIGLFKVLGESAVAAGIRRIEATTHHAAFAVLRDAEKSLGIAAGALKAKPAELVGRIESLQAQVKKLETDVKNAKRAGSTLANDLIAKKELRGNVPWVVAEVEPMPADDLRGLVEEVKQKLSSGIVLLAMQAEGKSTFVAGVTKDLLAQHSAVDVVNRAVSKLGGRGGGKPELAMAGAASTDVAAGLNAAA